MWRLTSHREYADRGGRRKGICLAGRYIPPCSLTTKVSPFDLRVAAVKLINGDEFVPPPPPASQNPFDYQRSMGFVCTPLVPIETKGSDPATRLISDDGQELESSMDFRHSGTKLLRARVLLSFERLMIGGNRLHNYLHCGSGGWIMQSLTDPDRYTVRCQTCRDRWCPACAKSRAMVLRCNLEPLIASQTVRFITLTLKHNDETLRQRLDKLFSCFKRLRKLPIWNDSVLAGVAFTEVKINKDTRRWHPHIHCLVTGKYLPLGQLQDAWLAVTGDSNIVDIRIVKDADTIAHYVTKYCTKPADGKLYNDPEALDAAIEALKGRRLVTTFGAWRGLPLLRNDTIDDWECVMPWPELMRLCRIGDEKARFVYRQVLRRDYECNDTTEFHARPPPPTEYLPDRFETSVDRRGPSSWSHT